MSVPAEMQPKAINNVISSILGQFGVATSQVHDTAFGIVQQVFEGFGIDATPVSLRWGKLVVEADAPTAMLVEYATDDVLAELQNRCGDEITSVRVQVRR